MPDQIEKVVKSERVSVLSELEAELRSEYYDRLVGKKLEMLVESSQTLSSIGESQLPRTPTAHQTVVNQAPVSGESSINPIHSDALQSISLVARGTSCRYAPVETVLSDPTDPTVKIGELLPVEIVKSDGKKLNGRLIL